MFIRQFFLHSPLLFVILNNLLCERPQCWDGSSIYMPLLEMFYQSNNLLVIERLASFAEHVDRSIIKIMWHQNGVMHSTRLSRLSLTMYIIYMDSILKNNVYLQRNL